MSPHKTEGGWFHLGQATGYKGGDVAKLKYWGLLEEAVDVAREDGGKTGVWRFTELGAAWVQGRTTVPKYAYVYNGHLRRLDGPPITIQQALGDRFNLRDLMGPTGPSSEES